MVDVFVAADNITSPLGFTTADNFAQLKNSVSAIKRHEDETMSAEPFYAALFDKSSNIIDTGKHTRFERLLIQSVAGALLGLDIDITGKKTVLIVSSTKGNISLLENHNADELLKQRIALTTSAKIVAAHFNMANNRLIVSNACISGVLGIITGMRLLQSGLYENAVVVGADVISKFVLSGFQSFQAISAGPCKPFDKNRTGLSLGEGASTIILSSNKKYNKGIRVAGGTTGNDANHISGPSRTGSELCHVMALTMKEAGVVPPNVSFISAHGTATVYNDEMEAKAISLAGLAQVPVNSLKGFYGHTLGAAGLIESVVTLQSMREGVIIPTVGFEELGVSQSIQVSNSIIYKPLQHCLKTASGFGGCNSAVLFSQS